MTDKGCCSACTVENDTHGMITALEARDTQLTEQVAALEANHAAIVASLAPRRRRTITLQPRDRSQPDQAD
jgi:hypothetical protein